MLNDMFGLGIYLFGKKTTATKTVFNGDSETV